MVSWYEIKHLHVLVSAHPHTDTETTSTQDAATINPRPIYVISTDGNVFDDTIIKEWHDKVSDATI
jgi:hypothetical protein